MVSSKISKFTLVLTLAVLCCFIFAGTVLAVVPQDKMEVFADGNKYAYTGCSNSYTFEITNVPDMPADCLNNPDGSDIIIEFTLDGVNVVGEPQNNAVVVEVAEDSTVDPFIIDEDYSLPVKIYVEDESGVGEWYFSQPTVEVTDVDNDGELEVLLHLEDMQINAADRYITKIFVGDDRQDLRVTNPCTADEYCIDLFVMTKCETKEFGKTFEVKSSPHSADINVTCESKTRPCEENLLVSGKVYDCGSNGVGEWPVTVNIIDDYDNVVATASGDTDGNGDYWISVQAEIAPGDYTAELIPGNDPCNFLGAYDEFEILPNLATQIDISVVDFDGADDQLRLGKCNDVVISLLDDCGYPATVDETVTVYISATTAGEPPVVGGHFFNECPDDNCMCWTWIWDIIVNGWDFDGTEGWEINDEGRDYGQINSIEFTSTDFDANGTSKVVSLIPLSEDDITIKARVQVGSKKISQEITVPAVAPHGVELEITPLVTDENGNAKAGWPLAAAVRLDLSAGAEYPVSFSSNGADIVYGERLTAAFDIFDLVVEEANKDYPELDYQTVYEILYEDSSDYEYCAEKQYFFIYPDDDTLGSYDFTVTVNGVGTSESETVNFVSPVEMKRTLMPDAWQTFSTPKYLASPGNETPQFGTFEEFLAPLLDELGNDRFGEIFILGYRNGSWELPDLDEDVTPLEGYFIRTPQRDDEGRAPYELEYVFARATTPAYSLPAYTEFDFSDDNSGTGNELDGQEWNSVGVGVNPEMDFGDELTRQADSAAQAFSSLLKGEGNGAYMVWNPGSKLGNVNDEYTTISLSNRAFESYIYDPFEPVFNGDVYWLYTGCSCERDYSANVGLEIIEWIGAHYSGYNSDR